VDFLGPSSSSTRTPDYNTPVPGGGLPGESQERTVGRVLRRSSAVVLVALVACSSSAALAATPIPGAHYILHGADGIAVLHVSGDGKRLIFNTRVLVGVRCLGHNVLARQALYWTLGPAPEIDLFGHVSHRQTDHTGRVLRALSVELWFTSRTTVRGLVWSWASGLGDFCTVDAMRLTGHLIYRVPLSLGL
jgi:hypothetical protein